MPKYPDGCAWRKLGNITMKEVKIQYANEIVVISNLNHNEAGCIFLKRRFVTVVRIMIPKSHAHPSHLNSARPLAPSLPALRLLRMSSSCSEARSPRGRGEQTRPLISPIQYPSLLIRRK